MDSSNLEENEFVCCEFEIAACKPSLQDLKNECNVFCGKIFVSEKKNFVLICTFCEKLFSKIEEFMFHLKRNHRNNMKWSINKFDYDEDDQFQYAQANQESKIVNDVNQKNDTQYTTEISNYSYNETYEMNDKQNVDEIPEIVVHDSENEENKNITEKVTKNIIWNRVNVRHDHGQDIKENTITIAEKLENVSNSKNINAFSLDADKDDEVILKTDPITLLSENDDRLKSQKKKKQMNKNFEKKFYCPICPRNFGSEKRFQTHNFMYHHHTDIVKSINTNITCGTCNKSFATQENFKTHLLVCCSKIGSKSVKVDQLTMESDVRKKNEINVNEVNTQNCEGTVFAESIGLNPCICKFCYKQLKTPLKRSIHELIHTGEKPFSCEFCKKTFRLKYTLDTHKMIHKGIKLYKCEICELSFTLSTNLAVHMKRHLGERKHKCDYCDKKFVTSSEKKTHLRIHTGEKPYKCRFCNKGFPRSSFLTEHIQKVHSEETFKCEQCEKVFSTKKNLKVHTKTHSKERPFECNVCQKRFLMNKNLQVHLKIHSNATQYLCSICGKGFQQCSGLGIHMKTHKIEKNDK